MIPDSFRRLTYCPTNQQHHVVVGQGLLEKCAELILPFLRAKKIIIVIDQCLLSDYRQPLLDQFAALNIQAHIIPIQGGEQSKTIATLDALVAEIVQFADRQTAILAIGGGVIGDLVGFVASILLRGLDWFFIPTTLIAQVDSAIGGKTGINLKSGKNLLGSFHFSTVVITDVDLLRTLPISHIRSGFSELIKHALIQDLGLFERLENANPGLLNDFDALHPLVYESSLLKIDIIGDDWFETQKGTRCFLNLGHTFAHGFEGLDGLQGGLLHGEAVALGICAAYDLAACNNFCSHADAARVRDLLVRFGLPVNYHDYLPPVENQAHFIGYLQKDKKNQHGQIAFILPRGIGKGCLVHPMTADAVVDFLWRSRRDSNPRPQD